MIGAMAAYVSKGTTGNFTPMNANFGIIAPLGYKVKGGKLYLGEDAVLDVPGVADQEVHVGIRPEGFELDPNGPMICNLNSIEVMGRDSSVVSTHDASQNPVVRSIIDADNKVDESAETVRFTLKPHKVFLFHKETEERIYFEVK